MTTPITSTTSKYPNSSFSKERHEAIHAVKAILKARTETSAALHVLYNLLRALDARRGFSSAKSRGLQTHRAFQAAVQLVPALARSLGIALDPDMQLLLNEGQRTVWVDTAGEARALGNKFAQLGAYQAAMRFTPHGANSTVEEHGRDCDARYAELCAKLNAQTVDESWPDWLKQHGQALRAAQLPAWTMSTYLVNHDIGKVTTLTRDAEGRLRFPGHAEESAKLWTESASKPEKVSALMGLDMVLHTQTAEVALERVPLEFLPSLLLSTYAELLSNAQSVFGGLDSDSSKIKFKAFNKRATRVCAALYGESVSAMA